MSNKLCCYCYQELDANTVNICDIDHDGLRKTLCKAIDNKMQKEKLEEITYDKSKIHLKCLAEFKENRFPKLLLNYLK